MCRKLTQLIPNVLSCGLALRVEFVEIKISTPLSFTEVWAKTWKSEKDKSNVKATMKALEIDLQPVKIILTLATKSRANKEHFAANMLKRMKLMFSRWNDWHCF